MQVNSAIYNDIPVLLVWLCKTMYIPEL